VGAAFEIETEVNALPDRCQQALLRPVPKMPYRKTSRIPTVTINFQPKFLFMMTA
jgi:hypothetical protein